VTEEANISEAELAKPQAIPSHSTNITRTFDENQPKILVVDDEEPVRELLRDLLEHEGCRVYMAPGSREALGLFEVHQFDGIFTDVGMPGMSGWELSHAIRERNQQIPIAVVTGWGEAVGSDEQKEAGVDWVIAKPFRAEKISEIAQEMSRKRAVAVKRAALAIVAA
jgi:CheY-like chemotaxis protein